MNSPLTLQQAQETGCCRICGKDAKSTIYSVENPLVVSNPLVLNYGKEFAHQKCLDGLEKEVKVNDDQSLLNSTDNDKKITVGVGMPQALYLNEFGSLLWSVFGDVPYHVGSSLTKKSWRDVDIRIMLDDAEWKQWGFKPVSSLHQDGKWAGLCMAFSELGKKLTGLPIDFQIQLTDDANAKYSSKEGHQRSALGFIELRFSKPSEFELKWKCDVRGCDNLKQSGEKLCYLHKDRPLE